MQRPGITITERFTPWEPGGNQRSTLARATRRESSVPSSLSLAEPERICDGKDYDRLLSARFAFCTIKEEALYYYF